MKVSQSSNWLLVLILLMPRSISLN
ncbi:hypothetical protein ACHAWF_015658 [Thalassiosira exigua]